MIRGSSVLAHRSVLPLYNQNRITSVCSFWKSFRESTKKRKPQSFSRSGIQASFRASQAFLLPLPIPLLDQLPNIPVNKPLLQFLLRHPFRTLYFTHTPLLLTQTPESPIHLPLRTGIKETQTIPHPQLFPSSNPDLHLFRINLQTGIARMIEIGECRI